MADSTLTVPDAITFEAAIAFTQSLLTHIEQGQLSEAALETTLADLVRSQNGARGFFVTYLTDDRPFADQPPATVVRALRSSPEVVAELLVKNLAMSSAMAITHRRQQNETMAAGSDRVRSRVLGLIQQLQLPLITEKAQQLYASAKTGEGAYQPFLDRWGYDAEQRQAMQDALAQVLD